MPSLATSEYQRLSADLDKLLAYHPSIENPGPGKPKGDTGPLLRASIVLLVTGWENYVEQVILEAYDAIVPAVSSTPSLLSDHVRKHISSEAKKDVWTVTGSGWQDVAKHEIVTLVGKMNNASSGQVEGLFAQSLGLANILTSVSWKNRDAQAVRSALVDLVDLRGEIVHKGRTYSPLNLRGLSSWRDFVDRVVERLDLEIAAALVARYGITRPW